MPTPARVGYRLKDFAEKDREDFDDYYGDRGCACFISAPCGCCTHPGNPLNQAEDDDCWEIDTEEEMSRTEIVNKTKSQWFGYKYRVNIDAGTALIREVFNDGGKKSTIDMDDSVYYLVVDECGTIRFGITPEAFASNPFPEKKIKLVNGVLVEDKEENFHQNEDKGFTISPKGVKIDNSTGAPEGYDWTSNIRSRNWINWDSLCTVEDVVECGWLIKKDSCITEKDNVKSDLTSVEIVKGRESVKPSVGISVDWSKLENITPNDMFGCALIVNNKEENTMTNKTNRRAVIVRVWDNDVSLPVEDALVLTSDEILTEDNDQAVIQEFLAQGDIKGAIIEHNKVREKTVNVEILNRVGNKVMLQPIRKISELTIEVVKV